MNYIGYCRVYLDGDARDRYIDYVKHEEDMRRRLSEHKNSGRSLDEWYREVFLTSDLTLARREIFSHNFQRSIFGGEWSVIKTPHNAPNIIESNQNTLRDFLSNNEFTNAGRFPIIQKPLIEVYNELLIQFRFNSNADVGDYTALLYVLEKHLDEVPEQTCTVFLMSCFENKRFRSLNDKNQIAQYFQGRNDRTEGLRDMKGTGITFQLYVFDLEAENGETYNSVVGLATFIPEEISVDLIRWA
jgi:hypothetical protein